MVFNAISNNISVISWRSYAYEQQLVSTMNIEEETCKRADFCFSEVELLKFNKACVSSIKLASPSFHHDYTTVNWLPDSKQSVRNDGMIVI